MSKTCIAVDIGASSGRLIKSTLVDGKFHLEEIHRFKNQMTFENDHYYWDIDSLVQEIENGLAKMTEAVDSIGIDTWGVDYVLVDENGERCEKVFAYRDHRTDDTMPKVFEIIPKEDLYSATGIQLMSFNTVFQLFEHVKSNHVALENAKHLLQIPDYLNFRLTGVVSNEFTNATTSQLINIHTRDWDQTILEKINVPTHLFGKPVEAGTILGKLKPELVTSDIYTNTQVVAPATHDTGSAVAAIPALDPNFAYISSGTWSLMGIESTVPLCDETCYKYNFTNEGGVFGTVRVLKNIMGLWLIQEVKRIYNDQYSFAELVALAQESSAFYALINPNDARFLNPPNMIEAIQDFCKSTGQNIPETPGQISRCIFESLALQYNQVMLQLKEISTLPLEKIHIVGGGCQNQFLNQLCADFTGVPVYAGPTEATALGNLLLQHIALGDYKDLNEGRHAIYNSFPIDIYQPKQVPNLSAIWDKFINL